MPRYELSLILKVMQRAESAAAVRRTVETLLERGAVVRELQNLGERSLPYSISRHNQKHTRGSFFLIDFHSAPSVLTVILNHLERDVDVIRPAVLKAVPLTQCCGPAATHTANKSSSVEP